MLIGGTGEGPAGAAWVFTDVVESGPSRAASFLPLAPSGAPDFGDSVALSSDGDVALIGGFLDTDNGPQAGAAWLSSATGHLVHGHEARSQQRDHRPHGPRSFFGHSVALSGDGSTALIGGWGDNNYAGAAWIFSDASGPWTQVQKLTPSDETGSGAFGKRWRSQTTAAPP